MTIKTHPLPETALLQTYAQNGTCFTDCYAAEISSQITLKDYIAAFYTTPLFKLERFILKIAVKAPSTDEDAVNLAKAETTKFAIWDVEGRTDDQILLCEFSKRTRSWLHVEPTDTGTRLYFGSAVVPDSDDKMGSLFHALLPFHKLYSRGLLWFATRRLKRHST